METSGVYFLGIYCKDLKFVINLRECEIAWLFQHLSLSKSDPSRLYLVCRKTCRLFTHFIVCYYTHVYFCLTKLNLNLRKCHAAFKMHIELTTHSAVRAVSVSVVNYSLCTENLSLLNSWFGLLLQGHKSSPLGHLQPLAEWHVGIYDCNRYCLLG
jgi:hypothetical protein